VQEGAMIPYRDSLRSRTFPIVNYALIAINIIVFVYELSLQTQAVSLGFRRLGFGNELDVWISQWGVVPCRLAESCPPRAVVLESGAGNEWINLITSQFIHGGISHILGNMLFLWIFGDNVEDAMGHVRYLLFYLLGGVIAGLAQIAVDANGTIPSVGASGAIAAVLGAYLVTYPRASVAVLIPIWIIPWLTRVPAILMMGFWFLTQLISVGAMANARGGGGGVAYWAHIGGFLAGVVLVWFFRGSRRSVDVNERYEQYRWR
jgi:membrane associated rhomboid family serine protease